MVIYKSTNQITGEFYIGLSSKTMESRKRAHLSAARRGYVSHFCSAIRKYGESSFVWEVIDSSAKSMEELKLLERKFIAEMKPHYNKAMGGDGMLGWKPTAHQRLRMRMSKLGHQWTPEQRLAASVARKGRKFPNRKRPSAEAGRRISEALTGKKKKPLSLETKSKISLSLKAYYNR